MCSGSQSQMHSIDPNKRTVTLNLHKVILMKGVFLNVKMSAGKSIVKLENAEISKNPTRKKLKNTSSVWGCGVGSAET